MTDLTFLPWLRQGMAATIAEADDGEPTMPRAPLLDVTVQVDGQPANSQIRLRPADHALAIDTTQIARRYPAPNADSAETGYWPAIEFVVPDLCWVLTPLGPDDGRGSQLRPWLVLVCLPESAATFEPASGSQPATITSAPGPLGDLTRSALWAHVQSTVTAAEAAAAVGTGQVICRLVAPIALEPDTTYRAALVPAFTLISETTLGPAWDSSETEVTLPVFDTWTFATGQAPSFQALVELLEPVEDDLDMNLGIHSVDLSDLGAIEPWDPKSKVNVDYAGALIDTDLQAAELGRPRRSAFNQAATRVLNQGDHRVELAVDAPDPVVTPPLYGSYARNTHLVPARGWLRNLNLNPRHRMAAGLGAHVVQVHQERYMAAAWAQAGQVQEMRRALNATRLQAEINRTWKARADRLDGDQHAGLLRAQYTAIRTPGQEPARRAMVDSGVPNGLVDPAFTRLARPGGSTDRAARRRWTRVSGDAKPGGGGGRPGQQVPGEGEEPRPDQTRPQSWQRGLGPALGEPELRSQIRLGAVDAPGGAVMTTYRSHTVEDLSRDGIVPTRNTSASRFNAEHPDTLSLDRLAGHAQRTMRPMRSARQRATARLRGLDAYLSSIGWNADEVPVRVKIGPRINEALMWALTDESTDLLMPGVGEFPNNRARLVLANTEFVAAFMAGANHEMTRELLWREYPADMGSTTFRRFWDRPNTSDVDIDPLHLWKAGRRLDDIGAGGGEAVVLLARGEVFRHYPTMSIQLRDPKGVITLPSFGGRIPPATRFFAFDVNNPDDVMSGDWKVIFEEQPSEPRFGVEPDPDDPDRPPVDVYREFDVTNSATFAAESYQPPFRFEFDVIDLVGEGS